MIALRRFAFFFPLVLLLGSSGCGPRIGDISGRVRYKGKPVASGTVVLIANDKVPRYGTIQKDGTFSLNGVPVGEALLAVNCPDPRTLFVSAANKLGGQATTTQTVVDTSSWFPLPEKAGDPMRSGLKHDVIRGPNLVELDIQDN